MTKTQTKALKKLNNNWQSAYELQESLSTLNSLVRIKKAKSKSEIGSAFSPRTAIKFKLII